MEFTLIINVRVQKKVLNLNWFYFSLYNLQNPDLNIPLIQILYSLYSKAKFFIIFIACQASKI